MRGLRCGRREERKRQKELQDNEPLFDKFNIMRIIVKGLCDYISVQRRGAPLAGARILIAREPVIRVERI